MDKSCSVPLINLGHQENKGASENKDQPTKKKVSIPMIPAIPPKNANQNANQPPNIPLSSMNNQIPNIPTVQFPKSEGGLPLMNLSFASVPDLKINLSEMSFQDGKKKHYDKRPVVICVPFMADNNSELLQSNTNKAKDRPIDKKIINFFGGTAEFTDLYVNSITESPITVVEYNEGTPSLIPTFQKIDSAYQEIKHLPKMIDRVTEESSNVFAIIEDMMNEIERLKNQKEEMTVKNAVMKEKIRSSVEEAQRFNESAVKMKNSFDEFLKKIPKT